MDRVRLSPSEAALQAQCQQASSSSATAFLTAGDSDLYYELLQGRFGTSSSGAIANTVTTSGVNSQQQQQLSPYPPTLVLPSSLVQGPTSMLKMEPEMMITSSSSADPAFLSNNSYNCNWIVPPNPGYYADLSSPLGASSGHSLYSSQNHFSQGTSSSLLDSHHFGYNSKVGIPAAATACQSPGQIQALRDFMAGHGTTTISSSHELPIINPSPHCSRASSMGTFYQQHDDEIGADTMVVVAATAAAAAEGDYAAQQLLSERQSSKQELMAYRSLCSEIYATERSPHRSQFQRENHILAERQRREEMNEKFSALRAMIPKATKKDKASIVGDTINYVLELEKRLKHLQGCKDIEGGGGGGDPSSGFFKSTKRKVAPLTAEEKKGAEVDVQKLGNQAVIKLVCSRTPGQVLRVLHALDECKVDLLQSNVTTVGDISVHFVTVQLEAGVSVTTEELISALLLAACPN
ncbi:unnamed protein product [Sphagnum jensenii]|uniref:BHLH domain-containing protein n=1 Tax=Sphagnum jensenii TaxID=128206 RepID=A0ABP0WDU0_9BRYO